MKIKEIRQKSPQELHKLLAEKRERLRKLRFDLANRQIKDVGEFGRVRKDIARILTILRER